MFRRIFRWLGVVLLALLLPLVVWGTSKVQTAPLNTQLAQARTEPSSPNNAYFGDLHMHTGYSFDAYIYNVRTTPDDAYQFAKGAAIPHAEGFQIQNKTPLDFLAVTDHSEYMGIFPQLGDPDSQLSNHPYAAPIQSGQEEGILEVYLDVASTALQGSLEDAGRFYKVESLDEPDIERSVWQDIIDTANKHYEPGKFTTFPAFEWSSMPNNANLHRNVIFKTDENLPELTYSSFDSYYPEELWKWMEEVRDNGATLLAIPHNPNLSNGKMYELQDSFGNPIDAGYAAMRSRNEPLSEAVQIKGQSETHPNLSPDDRFANFEVVDSLLGVVGEKGQTKGSYFREAYRNGLGFQEQLGANPYQFGLIGSSDTHNSAGPYEEDNYFGKIGIEDGTPEKRFASTPDVSPLPGLIFGAAGLAGVWAPENTREAIYDALERKETFATSGPRIRTRMFGGWNLDGTQMDGNDWVGQAYASGVPMGTDLPAMPAGANAPSFVVWSMKDPNSGNLDRIQIVKGFSKNGQSFEQVYDVALSDDRQVGPDGIVPDVGFTVDISNASYSNSIGNTELMTVWTDPDFDPTQDAFYYARTIEIPTPRWSTYDAKRIGIAPPDYVPTTIQERAYTSPIWYTPSRTLSAAGLKVADLGTPLSEAEMRALLVGKTVTVTNRVTGEQLTVELRPDGTRTVTSLTSNALDTSFNVLHGAPRQVTAPYEFREGRLVFTVDDKSEYDIVIYQQDGDYVAARSNEFGFVNYEIIVTDLS